METLMEIIQAIQAADSDTLMEINNRYCQAINNPDGEIYTADQFDEIMQTFGSPSQIANRVHFGNWNPGHEYFTFDGYGNIEGFYSLDADNLPDSINTVATYIENNPDEFSDLFS